jgi:nucleotide-binding universal stress UspA family protein
VVSVIVVGVDGSDDSRRAVEWSGRLAAEVGARVIAVHAVGLLEHEPGDPGAEHLRPALDVWTEALQALPDDRVERRLVAGDPAGAVAEVVAETAADLLVVGTRGVGAHGAAGLGSTSLRLAERCACPLVVVPAPTGR